MEPKVSICIPTYKQTKYLKLCLDSVLAQSFKDYEVIITDDTPDDTVKNFVAGYKIPNLHYFKNAVSLGTPGNWNEALSKAKGKYIKVLHHDDYFLNKNSLGKFVDAAEKNNCSFVFSNTEVWHVSDNSRRIAMPNEIQLERLNHDAHFLFFRNKIGSPSATLFARNEMKFDENLKWLVDVDFYIRYLKKHPFIHLNEALVCTAHETPGQVTQEVQSDRTVQIKEHVLIFLKIKEGIKDKSKWTLFFEYLFNDFSVNSLDELNKIIDTSQAADFFKNVFVGMNSGTGMKKFKRRFYNSRFNLFKKEQF